ncbi:hypothetical protein C9374_008704 [Naegleria lovaniensis]|uniref:Uncharacterized protein n=1 Tax=Naegleria lovaniensis TaxID=51637 RepID=A0AA88GEP9_NAELO|nr:uncharacterized protein C9374_008704 [Naegleria lovaniensis]KAG2378082.1 hypothetical protein C9374_008704 [Naegleria lovaniensis]
MLHNIPIITTTLTFRSVKTGGPTTHHIMMNTNHRRSSAATTTTSSKSATRLVSSLYLLLSILFLFCCCCLLDETHALLGPNPYYCNGIASTSPSVCGGKGLCVGTNTCLCKDITATNTLISPGKLLVGQSLVSSNGLYRAEMGSNGNFIVFGSSLWQSNTGGSGNYLDLSSGGDLAVKSVLGIGLSVLTLVSNLLNSLPPYRLIMQNDGKLVLYDSNGKVVWNSPTGSSSPPTAENIQYGGTSCSNPICGGLLSTALGVCSGNGTCTAPGSCLCNSGFTGQLCDTFLCNGLSALNPLACSGHGICNGPDSCTCDSGFFGPVCDLFSCAGELVNSTNVCSQHGSCIAPNLCSCLNGYSGSECNLFSCNGILSNITNLVCNNHGTCQSPDQCICENNYFGVNCDLFDCFGLLKNNSLVCSGKGLCAGPDSCLCDSGFFGPVCDLFQCFDKLHNASNVCSGHGVCVGPDQCLCFPGYIGSQCEHVACNGILSNLTGLVCGGHGTCAAPDNCICDGGFFGINCDLRQCFGLLSNNSLVCSGKGLCNGLDNCVCDSGFFGPVCDLFQCFDKLHNVSNVCSGHGVCVGPDQCLCFPGYIGSQCEHVACNGILSNLTGLVCGGHGTCAAPDNCICDNDFFGINCDLKQCFGLLSNNSLVCSGKGLCNGLDSCLCDSGFFGPVCDLFNCSGKLASALDVCSGNGLCGGPDKCICNSGFFGELCDIIECGGVLSNLSNVCNSKGNCIAPNLCSCLPNVFGENCDVFKCFGLFSNNSLVCGGNGICGDTDSCICLPGFTSSDCTIDIRPFSISLSTSQAFVLRNETSFSVSILPSISLVPGLQFGWVCDNCGENEEQVFLSGKNLQSLTINPSVLPFPGSYIFKANASVFNGLLYPSRLSNLVTFNLTLVNDIHLVCLVNCSNNIIPGNNNNTTNSGPSLIQIGLPKFIVRAKDQALTTLDINSAITGLQSTSLQCALPLVFDWTLIEQTATTSTVIASKFGQSPLSIPVLPPSNPPISSSLLSIIPTQGVALTDQFNIQFTPWQADSALLPLKYALGFVDEQLQQQIRLTEFTTSTTISTILPFLKNNATTGLFKPVVFVMDKLGTIEKVAIPQTLAQVQRFVGSTTELLQKAANSTIAAFDGSFSLLDPLEQTKFIIQAAKDIKIDVKDPLHALAKLVYLSTNQTLLTKDIVLSLTDKLIDFVNSTTTVYKSERSLFGRVSSKISETNMLTTLSIASNILSSQVASQTTIDVIEQLVSMILLGEEAVPLTTRELPTKTYASSGFNIVVSKFRFNGDTSFDGLNTFTVDGIQVLRLNISYLLSKYNAFSKDIGISFIRFTDNTALSGIYTSTQNRTMISNINDIRFYLNDAVLILQDLEQPLFLTFPTIVPINSNSSQKDFISCRYWDNQLLTWSSSGCLLLDITGSSSQCSCNHTTMFSTFLERNSSQVIFAPDYVFDTTVVLYYCQAVFGFIMLLLSSYILVWLILYRKEQPVASRLVTPYLGIIALMIESSIAYAVQRSVLLAGIYETASESRRNDFDLAANIIANVVTIVVNTLNLTAIFAYLIQVCRYQLMKYLHKFLHMIRGKEQDLEKKLKLLRFITSNGVFATSLIIFAILNLCYWSLWVALRRSFMIDAETYTYIVSVSYTFVSLSLGGLISLVALFDLILSISNQRSSSKKKNASPSASSAHIDVTSIGASDNQTKKKAESPLKRIRDWFVTLDGPLYFRIEMMIYVLSFIFLVVNQAIGLSTLSMRTNGESITRMFNPVVILDTITFVFEILYAVSYLFVFGGFSLLVAARYIHSRKKQGQKKATGANNKQDDEVNEELQLVLDHEEGKALFEKQAIKELASENFYIYYDIMENKKIVKVGNISDITLFIAHLYSKYIKSYALAEVNIPSKCKNNFIDVYKRLLVMAKGSEAASLQHIIDDCNHFGLNKTGSNHFSMDPMVENDGQQLSTLCNKVEEMLDNLRQEILTNLSDTFSRFVLTDEYKFFLRCVDLQQQMREITYFK